MNVLKKVATYPIKVVRFSSFLFFLLLFLPPLAIRRLRETADNVFHFIFRITEPSLLLFYSYCLCIGCGNIWVPINAMTDIVDSSEYFPSKWIALLIPHFPSIELFCRICSLSLMNWISPSILTLGPPFCIAPLRWYCRCTGSSEYQFQLLSVQYAMNGRKMPLTRSLPLCPVVCRAETKVLRRRFSFTSF